MNELNINMDEEIQLWQERLFARSIRRRRKLDQLSELAGNTANLHCLEISAGDGVISASLHALGGSWKTAVTHQTAKDSLSVFLNEQIVLIDHGKLPYEDGTFDRVVIVDALRSVHHDQEFIRECHRVLKVDGSVIINEARRSRLGPTGILQRMLGVSPISRGQCRNGYRENELFNILKDGFDVPETIVYSNGLLESLIALGEFAQKSLLKDYYWLTLKKPGKDLLYRYRRINALAGFAYPLLWFCSKFEFLPGHQLLVKSRRRHWRPRLQPKLIDGRSIAEAAINTKIGTAAPF
jgi:2-polyprenyl-3-methyl-5-hydroxy-6-metoxy-1,4-benzoquinol methylase